MAVWDIADYGPAPLDVPEVYPGLWPAGAVMVQGTKVTPVPLPADTTGLTPILAIGSNACPAQLHRKAMGSVLLTPTVLRNHLVVYAAHVTSYGAVPATVLRWPGASSDVFISWLADDQHLRMDTSEGGNYDRVMLPTSAGLVPGYRAHTGLFCCEGRPVRLAAVRAEGDGLPLALTQTEVLEKLSTAC